jgi:hypothetical protein
VITRDELELIANLGSLGVKLLGIFVLICALVFWAAVLPFWMIPLSILVIIGYYFYQVFKSQVNEAKE